jgi:hypothetical protein
MEKKECVMCMERLRQVRLRCGHAGMFLIHALILPDVSVNTVVETFILTSTVSQCCAVLATTKCVAQHFLSVQCVGSGATRLKSQTMRWHDKLHLYSAKRAEESAGPHVLKISVYGCTYNKMKTFSHPGGARHFACAHLSWLAARCPLSLFSTVS